MTFEANLIRDQFPALNQNDVDGTRPIFFDNPAGTQVPQSVIDAVAEYYIHKNANAGGAFITSQRSDKTTEHTRHLMADFLNAPNAEDIAFGPNMTTMNFRLSQALGKTLQAGDEIVLTRMDHDANVAPWTLIARDHDLVVRWVDINPEDCTLDMNTLEAALTDKTKIVATVHASNAVGTINPVEQIAQMAHAADAYYVVDAVQSAPHLPLDVQQLDCDFLLCSAYKFFGPHIGILWGKHNLMQELPVYKVRPAKDLTPHRWEVGTGSYETVAGVGAALEYLAEIGKNHGVSYAEDYANIEAGTKRDFKQGMAALVHYERELVTYLLDVLAKFPKINVYGITDPRRFNERVPTVVFTMEGYTAYQVAMHLAQYHIFVWSGHYYAIEIMDRLGHEKHGMVRVGLAHYNTKEEIDRLGEALSVL